MFMRRSRQVNGLSRHRGKGMVIWFYNKKFFNTIIKVIKIDIRLHLFWHMNFGTFDLNYSTILIASVPIAASKVLGCFPLTPLWLVHICRAFHPCRPGRASCTQWTRRMRTPRSSAPCSGLRWSLCWSICPLERKLQRNFSQDFQFTPSLLCCFLTRNNHHKEAA